MRNWTGIYAAEPQRLDRALATSAPELSRGAARRLIAAGAVFLNGRRCEISSRTVRTGDRLRVVLDAPPEIEPTMTFLHDDDTIVAVDKPPGMPSVPTRRAAAGTASFLAQRALRERGERTSRLWVVHRLDAATSGVLLFARSAAAARLLSRAFTEGAVVKRYLAKLSGLPEVEGGEIDLPLLEENRTAIVSPKGKAARTSWARIEGDARSALVEVRPHTGRFHQIRAHLAAIGFPILGDRVYGGQPAPRLMLHARSVEFRHPASGDLVLVESPLPPFAITSMGVDHGRCHEKPRP